MCVGLCGVNCLHPFVRGGKNTRNLAKLETNSLQPSTSALLAWFDRHQRPLPWRADPDPYAVWLSEIILQQTRVDQGTRYWQRFMDRWPTVVDLAHAPLEDVLKMWQGLGYYARARNLHRAALAVCDIWGGRFPTTATDLRTLPGVGPYTAAAVASICFQEPVAAVDGNVQRVVTRFLGSDLPIDRPEGLRWVAAGATAMLDALRPGDFNQAMMELGATVCTPGKPRCIECPLQAACASGPERAQTRPVKAGRTRVEHVAWAFHVITDGTHVALRKRPENGVWGGLWEFPSDLNARGFHPENWRRVADAAPPMTHLLSHRRIEASFPLWVRSPLGALPEGLPEEWVWVSWQAAAEYALPRHIDKVWLDVYKAAVQAAAECEESVPTFGRERPTPWPESTK